MKCTGGMEEFVTGPQVTNCMVPIELTCGITLQKITILVQLHYFN